MLGNASCNPAEGAGGEAVDAATTRRPRTRQRAVHGRREQQGRLAVASRSGLVERRRADHSVKDGAEDDRGIFDARSNSNTPRPR